MYTNFLELNGTGSFYRPLFFEFPDDEKTIDDEISETQFLIGDFLMGAPIVEKSQNERKIYFPKDNDWYKLEFRAKEGFNHNEKLRMFKGGSTENNFENLLPETPPTFLRSGKLLIASAPATRTSKIDSNFTIYAALKNGKASGSILGISDYNN